MHPDKSYMSVIKKIRKRLDVISKEILDNPGMPADDYSSLQAELKTLRELIATHKAAASYEEDYGSDDDSGMAGTKRTSDAAWD